MEPAAMRVVAHFDVDCFYAQAEILRRPFLQERPVGVTQKFLVVTCNYVARHLGVPKMVTIQEAKRRCPDLVLINGEDLTPYRAASKEIMKVLGRFGTLERRGLDEAAVDITLEVIKRSRLNLPANSFSGYVLGLDDNCLQTVDANASVMTNLAGGDYLLMVGSQLVAEIRGIVEKETGFRCSCGIADNKMLAKLVCSINKPDKQTCILQSAVSTFLNPLAVRKLPGVGHQTELLLKEIGVETVADLQKLNIQQLSTKFGNRIGMFLYNACRGVDHNPVVDKGPLKSISVEDSFRSCTSLKYVEDILRTLAPDLLARLEEDREETGRRPKLLTVKWRHQGSWNFTSVSAPMPVEVLSTTFPLDQRHDMVVAAAMKLIAQSFVNCSFSLVVLNIGATNFVDNQSGNICASHDIRSFLHNSKLSKCEVKTMGNWEATVYEDNLQREDITLRDSKLAKCAGCKSENKAELQAKSLLQNVQKECFFGSQVKELDDTSNCSGDSQILFHRERLVYDVSREGSFPEEVGVIFSHQKSPVSGTSRSAGITSGSVFEDGLKRTTGFESDDVSTCLYSSEAGQNEELRQSPTVSRMMPMDAVNEEACIALHQENELARGGDESIKKPWILCEKCGQQVEAGDKSSREHADYHFALELESQERNFSTAVLAEPRSLPGSISRGKVKLSVRQSLSFGKKPQKGTLDTFVFRQV